MTKQNDPDAVSIDRPIVLIGMMGVGKTSVGKRLAEALNLPFVDSDHEIEAASARSIAEIFEEYGEAHFRDGERRVIKRLMDGKPRVIATGGGAFLNAETRDLILDQAVSIWLDADIDVLVSRLAGRSHRPLIKGKSAEEIREILMGLVSERNPLYAMADHHVVSNSRPHGQTIEAILKVLDNG